jgi:two-component system, cell cycle sensor histidine kinase and response regulator CckA
MESKTFRDSLLCEAEAPLRPCTADTGLPNPRKLILVVDDDGPLRVMMGVLLRRTGFRVLLAATSNDALRICNRLTRPIDLLITDIQLPELSGFDLTALMAIERPEMPVLFISGAFTEQDPELRTRLCSRTDFLAKPFAPKMLETKVESMLVASKGVRRGAGTAHFCFEVHGAC